MATLRLPCIPNRRPELPLLRLWLPQTSSYPCGSTDGHQLDRQCAPSSGICRYLPLSNRTLFSGASEPVKHALPPHSLATQPAQNSPLPSSSFLGRSAFSCVSSCSASHPVCKLADLSTDELQYRLGRLHCQPARMPSNGILLQPHVVKWVTRWVRQCVPRSHQPGLPRAAARFFGRALPPISSSARSVARSQDAARCRSST